jgi:hypothetical protein
MQYAWRVVEVGILNLLEDAGSTLSLQLIRCGLDQVVAAEGCDLGIDCLFDGLNRSLNTGRIAAPSVFL